MKAADVRRAAFGKLPDGRVVEAVTLTNGNGVEVRIITFGAAIQSVIVPDRDGGKADVALGYPTLDGYLAGSEYFGATVGRVANRIAQGRFTLDGKPFLLPVNNGPNSLHGGTTGFDKALWTIISVTRGARQSVTLRHVSPDGDQGYPGTLTVTATYSLDENNVLAVDYGATTDRTTIVNLSNHAYWNLAGEGSADGAMGHLLTIPADHYLPTDATAIPTGEFRLVGGTAFDFRKPIAVGARVRDASDEQIRFGRGYDHNWVVDRHIAAAPRLLARVEEPKSGRVLEVLSTQPGLQFYSGNFLDGTIVGKGGKLYRQGDAIALEPQMFPDTPNRPEFGSVRLEPGQTYRNLILFRFSAIGVP
ncbi:galactose mutarotase [Allosphingosinicella flava]|uniref:Aldose 1-epimerase n=1 Tax=Allosphingosinicella flava TaxID=2771430 RepID=A0A7T2GIA1_9SPHN|nr:aldose epimerase family protein [Sphingosinicella flava]QPQ54349.1 galactose mutarotase [Sphingosinicella flava]